MIFSVYIQLIVAELSKRLRESVYIQTGIGWLENLLGIPWLHVSMRHSNSWKNRLNQWENRVVRRNYCYLQAIHK